MPHGRCRQELDVSRLEAPEPLTRALMAVSALTPAEVLILHHRREPSQLLQYLTLRGLRCTVRPGTVAAVEIWIWQDSVH